MTGFTYLITEKNIDFKKFALECMNAFVRHTNPNDYADTSYEEENLKDAQEDLAAWRKKTKAQQLAEAKKQIAEGLRDAIEAKAGVVKDNNKLEAILTQAEQWEPPTKDHERFKEFMIEQLTSSISSLNYYDRAIEEYEKLDPIKFRDDWTKAKVEKVKRRKVQLKEVVANYSKRREWVEAIHNSFETPKRKR